MNDQTVEQTVAQHYGARGLLAAIDAELRSRGLNPEQIQPADLDALDHFHTAGKQATIDLAALGSLGPGMKVIDVGGGTGGPARMLAATYSCQVTVLDLTKEFCSTGAALANRVGLGGVSFCHGSALSIPFAAERFDLAWTMQSSMNIPDKKHLYAEIRRVLRRGGRLVLQEYMAGPGGPPLYPTPFAQDASMAFLLPAHELRAVIRGAGFREVVWRDVTESLNRLPAGHRMVSLVHGADEELMQRNMRRNREEQRLVVVQAMFEKAG